MRSDLRCEDVRPQLSAFLDDELTKTERSSVVEHLSSCTACNAHLERISHVRQLVRLQPVEQVPDLTDRITDAVAGGRRPTSVRPYLRTAALAAAAALIIFLGTSVDVFDRTRDVATATEIVHEVQAAARDVSTYRATFDIVERGWHPDVDVRTFTARVWFAAPERFRLEVRDTTRYPEGAWPRNAVTLVASPRRWSISEPSACPVVALPACSVGATRDERTIVDRQPFDGNSALPTDIAVPLETLSSASALRVLGSDESAHHVELTYQQAAPLVRALQQGGSWRPFHPLDRVRVRIDRETWFPERFRVLATDSPDRVLWAERNGVRPEPPGRVLLDVRAREFEEPARLPDALFRSSTIGAVSSGGFGPMPGGRDYPSPDYTAGLSLYREGATGPLGITTFTDGMTWLKLTDLEREGAVAAYTGGAEIVSLNEGAAFYLPADERHGRRVEIYGPSTIRVESNLPRSELLRVASSVGISGEVPERVQTPDDTMIRRIDPGTVSPEDRPGYLPAGYRMVAAVASRTSDATSLSLYFRQPQTSYEGPGIRVLRSTAYAGLAPSSEEFVNVRVNDALGRWSFERSELEWMDGEVYRAVSVPGADLSTALSVAESLR